MNVDMIDLRPVIPMLVAISCVAFVILWWFRWKHRRSAQIERQHAFALGILFLCFDLVLFGAFTRLTDSGLGCPDWPGCYGNVSPSGAAHAISTAQSLLPDGPVTHTKAWIEMIHRFLAALVGALIAVQVWHAWNVWRKSEVKQGRLGFIVALLTLLWVCIQGAFGALTVTMKLFPAIVSLHLLGGYVLLGLLAIQTAMTVTNAAQQPPLKQGSRLAIFAGLIVLFVQASTGAWVSTNYAVLACDGFPMCQGSWWPEMHFKQAFELWRPLGMTSQVQAIDFSALVAMQFVHRVSAVITLAVLGALAYHLWKQAGMKKLAKCLVLLLVLQFFTGLTNVVLDWPILAAVMHTGGAGALVVTLVWCLWTSYGHRHIYEQ